MFLEPRPGRSLAGIPPEAKAVPRDEWIEWFGMLGADGPLRIEFPGIEISSGYVLHEAGFDPFDDVVSFGLIDNGREMWVIIDGPRAVFCPDNLSDTCEILIATDNARHRVKLSPLTQHRQTGEEDGNGKIAATA